jgi:acyl carrier protein
VNERLREVMAEVLEVPASSIDETTTQESLEEWTSLSHLRLIGEIERAFGVRVAMERALELNTVAALLELLDGAS